MQNFEKNGVLYVGRWVKGILYLSYTERLEILVFYKNQKRAFHHKNVYKV